MKKFIKWIAIALFIFLALLAGFAIWAENPLGPQDSARQALTSDSKVIIENGKWITVKPTNEESTTGLILYPGGRVDPLSYLPIARSIAEKGYLVVIVPMPLNLAVFNSEAARQVMAAYPEIEHWAVGGHSLGGAMAARFAVENPSLVDGLVLWAAYPASSDDLSQTNLKVVSIIGSEDGVAAGNKIESSRALLPQDTRWISIKGGNHAQFGDYGKQPGDNPALISPEDQQAQAAQATVDLLDSMQDFSP